MNTYVDPACLAFVAEQRTKNAELRRLGLKIPPPGSVNVAKLRRSRSRNAAARRAPLGGSAPFDKVLSTASGDVLTRVFPGRVDAGIMIHFHGGGWVLGSVYEQDSLLASLVGQTGCTAISVDYPLAPEHGMEQALATAGLAASTIILSNPGKPVCVIGESAGAQIALQTVLAPSPLRHRLSGISLT